jgi:predicted MFS family arabinose efflux permease
VITTVCGASSLAALACAVAPSLATLLAARVFAGAMAAGLIPLSMAWIGDAVPYERRQPVIARFAIGQILGVSLGQLLGGIASDLDARAAPFLLLTVMFAASTVLLLRQRGSLRAERAGAATAGKASAGKLLGEFLLVLREPRARLVLLAVFLEGGFVLGAFAFFATHLHRNLGLTLTAAGSLSMLFGLGGLLFSANAGRFIGRWGERGLVRRGGLLLLLTMTAVALFPQVALVAVACLAMGVAFYMVHSTLQTNATQMSPTRRGASVAAFALSYFVGQAAGVAAVGWAIGLFDVRGVIIACAAGVAITALLFSSAASPAAPPTAPALRGRPPAPR